MVYRKDPNETYQNLSAAYNAIVKEIHDSVKNYNEMLTMLAATIKENGNLTFTEEHLSTVDVKCLNFSFDPIKRQWSVSYFR